MIAEMPEYSGRLIWLARAAARPLFGADEASTIQAGVTGCGFREPTVNPGVGASEALKGSLASGI